MRAVEEDLNAGKDVYADRPGLRNAMDAVKNVYPLCEKSIGFGSTIFAVKPGDGSAGCVMSEGAWRMGKYCQ